MTKTNRKGRWSAESILNALDRLYAVNRGRYETIEQDCESAGGVAELLELQDRVDSDRALMRRTLEAIEVVARHVDPTWTPAHIKPITPRNKYGQPGDISRAAMRILRVQGRPMTVRELARSAAGALGLPLEERQVARLDLAIRASFDKQIGKNLGVEPGVPKRYFILAKPSAAGSGRGHHPSDAANSLSTPSTPEPTRRRA